MVAARTFKWKYSGCDWNEVGKTRLWVFLGNRQCVEYTLRVEDCDGDLAYWDFKVSDASESIASGQTRDIDQAIAAVEQFATEFVNNLN